MNNGFYQFPKTNQISAKSASYAVSSSYAEISSYVVSSSYSSTASYALDSNASTIDVYVFGSDVDSYLLMSNVAGATGVAIGGDADLRYNTSTNKLTVGTISAISLTGSLQGTSSWGSKAVSADNTRTPSTTILSSLGSVIKAEPLWGGFQNYNATNLPLTNQRLILSPVYIYDNITITGVKWVQTISGSYTAANYNGVGLFTYNTATGNLTNVVSSSNNGNTWSGSLWTNGTFASASFGSTYNASPGLYYIGALWATAATTTVPNIGGFTATNALTWDFTNSAKAFGFIASQTSMPTSVAMSTLTTANNNPYLVLF